MLKRLPKVVRDISFRPDESREDGKVDYRIESKIGTFDFNNGMLSYVDRMGDVYCVPFRFSLKDIEGARTSQLLDRIANIYGAGGQNVVQMIRDAGKKD